MESTRNSGSGNSTDQLNASAPPTRLYFRVQFKTKTEWCVIVSPCTYDEIIAAVKGLFPTLETEFTLQDEFGANLRGDFLEEYIKISPRGVLLKIREPQLQSFDSASTLTKYTFLTESLQSDTSSFGEASENSSTPGCSRVSTPGCSHVLTSYSQKIITSEELKEFIQTAPGGKEVYQFYNKFGTLNDSSRKKLVNISVNFLQRMFPESSMPSSFSREQCARALIEIFPTLKDGATPAGYEAFYDPVTKKGFLTTRLRTLLRKKEDFTEPKKLKLSDVKDTETVESSEIKEAIEFIRHADPAQDSEIKQKLKLSFLYRRNNQSDILPRFLDTKGLISYEFSSLYPENGNGLLNKWSQYREKILKVYEISVKNPLASILENEDRTDATWNKDTKALFALICLLPPTAKGRTKGNRESGTSAQEYLLVFKKTEVPIKDIFQTRKSRQPFLLAVGPNKVAIHNYYIVFDENIVSAAVVTGEVDIVHAVDALLKVFFIFNIKYPEPLQHFWEFIQDMFYDIHKGIVLTSRMRELRTKLHNLQ